MPVSDQGADFDRYMLIPRVLIFLRLEEAVLLIKGAADKRLWAGKYNGIGGHVEPGEDILTAARRELLEETGLRAALSLCGTVVVDTGRNPGIGMYIFTGEAQPGKLADSPEGVLEWVPFSRLPDLPVVEDIPVFLERIREWKVGDPVFHVRSYYEKDRLKLVFAG